MKAAVEDRFAGADIVMAAAVSDFRFQRLRRSRKKETFRAGWPRPTDDILAGLGRRKDRPGKIRSVSLPRPGTPPRRPEKLAKRLDLIVATDVGEQGIGFESEFNRGHGRGRRRSPHG
jgi:phosphopantothenoylcysteine synthetase/decarboxylase